MFRRVLYPMLALAALAAALAACGGEQEAGGAVASVADDTAAAQTGVDEGDGSGSGSQSGADDVDREEAQLRFARCMREHGVDMEDPKPGEGLRIRARRGEQGTLEKAQAACREHLEGVVADLTAEDRQRMREAGLEFARCMREHGIDMPDPTGEGGMQLRVGPGTGIDPEDPAFQKAQTACEGIMRDARPGGDAGERGRQADEDGQR